MKEIHFYLPIIASTKYAKNEKAPVSEKIQWEDKNKSYYISAFLVYLNILFKSDKKSNEGVCITYDKFDLNISREQISKAIKLLKEWGLINVNKEGRNNIYTINNYLETPWAKIPVDYIFKEGILLRFYLRTRDELNSLKLYFLLVTFRDNKTNFAQISYDKIEDYLGITRNSIRNAISKLISLDLIHLDRKIKEEEGLNYYKNFYRIQGVDSYRNDFAKL